MHHIGIVPHLLPDNDTFFRLLSGRSNTLQQASPSGWRRVRGVRKRAAMRHIRPPRALHCSEMQLGKSPAVCGDPIMTGNAPALPECAARLAGTQGAQCRHPWQVGVVVVSRHLLLALQRGGIALRGASEGAQRGRLGRAHSVHREAKSAHAHPSARVFLAVAHAAPCIANARRPRDPRTSGTGPACRELTCSLHLMCTAGPRQARTRMLPAGSNSKCRPPDQRWLRLAENRRFACLSLVMAAL